MRLKHLARFTAHAVPESVLLKIPFIFAGYLFLAAGAVGQVPEIARDDAVVEILLAKDDGSGSAGAAADGFLPTDVPIHCVVQLDSAKPTTVKMNLVAVNVAGVKPETRVVSTSYTTTENQNRVNFTGRPDGRWVTGRYRIDIYIGTQLAGSRDFTVQKSIPPKPSAEGVTQPKLAPRSKTPLKRSGGT